MKSIKVCIGSACYVRGASDVVEQFKTLIKQYNLQDEIELCGAFCTGHCMEAVAVIRWDGKFLSVSKENAQQIFEEEIIAYL